MIRIQPQIARLRGLILATRRDVKSERLRCYQQEIAYENLVDELMAVCNTATTCQLDIQSSQNLKDLLQRLKQCRVDLHTARHRTTALEDILSNHEYEFEQMMNHIYAELDTTSYSSLAQEPQFQPDSTYNMFQHNTGTAESVLARTKLYS